MRVHFAGSSKIKIEQLTSGCMSQTIERTLLLGTVVYACNPSTQSAEAGGSLSLKLDCI